MKLRGPEWNAPGGNRFPFAKQRVAVVITSLSPSEDQVVAGWISLQLFLYLFVYLIKNLRLFLPTLASDLQETSVSKLISCIVHSSSIGL